jgi:MraZ protein
MVMLDGNGRFLIPKRYLQAAGIQQSVKFIGMGDTVELWAAEKVEAAQMDSQEFGEALQDIMNISF